MPEIDPREARGHALPELRHALPARESTRLVERLARTESPALTARRARRAERSGAPHDSIAHVRALGSNVWDADGNRYVDLAAGFGALLLGHGDARVLGALREQSEKLVLALGDLHPSDVKVALLERLAALAPFSEARVMLGLSGSDAITAALKTAVLATGKPGVLAFDGGYHGLDYGPLALCGYNSGFRAPFAEQLSPHVVFAPYPRDGESKSLETSLYAVERALDARRPAIGAVVIEPIQGRGGVHVPPSGFLQALSALCRNYGALLVLDEIMTGLGRAGALLACDSDGGDRSRGALHVDLVCLGKGLGGGLPVSACIGRKEVMAAWGESGSGSTEALHTGTFFGHALGCATALATLDAIEHDRLPARALALEGVLRAGLGELADLTVRGRGLLLGIDLGDGTLALRVGRRLLERGYLTVPASADASVISLTPALTVAESQLEAFADVLREVLAEERAP